MRHTLMMVLATAVPMMAAAQIPPAQPTPTEPAPAPRVAPAPRPPLAPKRDRDFNYDFNYDFNFDSERFKLLAEDAARTAMSFKDEIRFNVEEARIAGKELAKLDFDRMKVDVEHAKFEALEAMKYVHPMEIK